MSWPPWIQYTTHLSHLLTVVSTSTSFYIYFVKHFKNNVLLDDWRPKRQSEDRRTEHIFLQVYFCFKNWNFVKLIFSWKTTWLSFVRSQVRAINHQIVSKRDLLYHNIKEFYNMELYPKAPIFFGLEKITKNTIIIVVFMTHIASNTSSLIGSVWRSEEGLAT